MNRFQNVIVVGLMLTASVAFAQAKGKKGPDYRSMAIEVMKKSFNPKGGATLDRLNQDPVQQQCSGPEPLSKEAAEKLQAEQLATIKYPEDGKYFGKWQEGEKIAQNGFGKQFSDDDTKPTGGNCYACHQLAKAEVAYGTIGPTLYQFGKLRGSEEASLKYAWGKLYNSNGTVACSNMPRFGHNGLLTEEQMKHVMAYLFDPESPVNKDPPPKGAMAPEKKDEKKADTAKAEPAKK